MKKLLEVEFLGAYYVTLAWKFWNYGQNKASPLEMLQIVLHPHLENPRTKTKTHRINST